MKNSTLNILKQQSKKQRTNYRNRINAVAVNRSTPASTIQNVLVGEEQKVQEKQDFLNRLTRMAYVHPTKEAKADTEKRDSKFWFIVPDEYAEDNKNNVGIESLEEEPYGAEIALKIEKYRDSVGRSVKPGIERVYDFISKEISPLLLALDGGVEQSRAVLHSVVSDIDNYPFLTLELLTREAVKMKLAQFIVSYFGLNKADAEELVKRIQPPKQREVVIPYGLKQTEQNSSG